MRKRFYYSLNIYGTFMFNNEKERAFSYLQSHKPRSKNLYMSCIRKLITRGYSFEISQDATKKFLSLN